MKFLGAILLAVCAVAVVLCSPVFDHDFDVQWQTWKMKYNKRYQPNEEERKRNNWAINNHVIEKHNAEESLGLHSYRQGLNRFADMSNEEFAKTMTMKINADKSHPIKDRTKTLSPEDVRRKKTLRDPSLPPYIDYRKYGQVTPVKDQGSCLASYAFSAIGAVESLYQTSFAKLVNLSAQNIIDCSSEQGNLGCSGGKTDYALSYMTNYGVENNTKYPYHSKGGKAGKCEYKPAYCQTRVSTYGFDVYSPESILQQDIVSNGPIAACIDGSRPGFKNYKSGIYNDPGCKETSNHCVLIVGYNATDHDKAYYIVKNSWGTQWGMEGYIYMSMFKDNQCGIANNYSYPTSLGSTCH